MSSSKLRGTGKRPVSSKEREVQDKVETLPIADRSAAHASFQSASVALPGPRGRTSGADGLQRGGVLSASAAEAVRGRSLSAASASREAGSRHSFNHHRMTTTKERDQ